MTSMNVDRDEGDFTSRNHHLLAAVDSMGQVKELESEYYAESKWAAAEARKEYQVAAYELATACGACALRDICPLTRDQPALLESFRGQFIRQRMRNRISIPLDLFGTGSVRRVANDNDQFCATNLYAKRIPKKKPNTGSSQ